MKRREFMTLVGGAFISATMPATLLAATPALLNRRLVLVELNGGNDGLNTVIPYADTLYYRLRPNLGIARDRVLQLDEQLGLHPAMQGLMPSWQKGELAFALGVGYPEPNRSHFRSIEIWETGSDSDQYLEQGWLAQKFAAHSLPASMVAHGIVIGDNHDGVLRGTHMRNIVMKNPEQFTRQAKKLNPLSSENKNPALQHLLRIQQQVHEASGNLQQQLRQKLDRNKFPKSPIGQSLYQVARLIVNNVQTPVFKVSHGSFDTHSNQPGQHQRLLTELADALAAFRNSMQEHGHWQDVLVMSYSEFGRRAAENGSRGTDHGTAAAHFFLGGKVKGGLYGKQPSLDGLIDSDLVHSMHFRRLYATVMGRWWGLPVIGGHHEAAIDCLA